MQYKRLSQYNFFVILRDLEIFKKKPLLPELQNFTFIQILECCAFINGHGLLMEYLNIIAEPLIMKLFSSVFVTHNQNDLRKNSKK